MVPISAGIMRRMALQAIWVKTMKCQTGMEPWRATLVAVCGNYCTARSERGAFSAKTADVKLVKTDRA